MISIYTISIQERPPRYYATISYLNYLQKYKEENDAIKFNALVWRERLRLSNKAPICQLILKYIYE